MFDTLIIFLKEFFGGENDFAKNQQITKNIQINQHAKGLVKVTF